MRITAVQPLLLSLPLAKPVVTAFGTMTHRHAVLVEVTTDAGLTGLGECWSNFPAWAPVERIATLTQGVAPLVVGADPSDPERLTSSLIGRLELLGIQCGARGPIFQAISGVDIALWDLLGKVKGQPIARLLRPDAPERVGVYGSGLGPTGVVEMARPYWEAGVRTFKLKVGFGAGVDRANLTALRQAYPEATLAVDANQAWDLEQTRAFAPLLREFGCRWMEEPVPAPDVATLARLHAELPCPVAGGENYYGRREFAQVLAAGAVGLVQPDVCKTGGISEAVAIGRAAGAAGLPFAPHYLGSAVGLAASLHVIAGVAGGLLMELDANPNPLREELLTEPFRVVDGAVRVPSAPGLGVQLDPAVVARYRAQR